MLQTSKQSNNLDYLEVCSKYFATPRSMMILEIIYLPERGHLYR